MPTRPLVAILVSALALTAGVAAGCSSSGDSSSSGGSSGGESSSGASGTGSSGAAASSSGTSGASSASSSGASGAGSSTSGTVGDPIAACITACEGKHPKGVVLGQGIDTCWGKSCMAQCSGIGTGTPKPPTTGSCKNPVSTPSAACSQCTVDSCCKAWDACFDNTDCAALNACSIACYK